MSFALLVACFSAEPSAGLSVVRRSAISFVASKAVSKVNVESIRHKSSSSIPRSMSRTSSSQSDTTTAYQGISRLETLQTLVSKYGVPGSVGCTSGNGDMFAATQYRETLHPYLMPISRSQSTGNFVCALKRVGGSDSDQCPIVESGDHFPGMKLLALNRLVAPVQALLLKFVSILIAFS